MSSEPVAELTTFWTASLADELLRFFTGRLKCPDTAAELTHDTYVGLQQSIRRTPPDNIRAMAFRIAVNLAIDHQRKTIVRDRYIAADDFDTITNTVPASTAQPDQILIARERLSRLNSALNRLPATTRTVFIMHGTEGLTYSEIAERLGISKSQVNKLLADAMRHCAQQVND